MTTFPESLYTSATQCVSLWSGAEEWRRRIEMIEAAREHLYVSTYYLEYDARGESFVQHLLAAQERGVEVRLAYDRFAQRLAGMSLKHEQRRPLDALLDRLRQSGAVVTVWCPDRPLARLLGAGNHIKIQLSEADEVIFGSTNISGRSIDVWSEFSVSMWGLIVAHLRQWFLAVTTGDPGSPVESLASEEAAAASGSYSLQLHWCNPWRQQPFFWPLQIRPSSVTWLLGEQIDQARHEIFISSFCFKPAPLLHAAVIRARRRGVRVVVLHSSAAVLWESDWPWLAAAAGYSVLLAEGIELYEHRLGEHSKIVCIDGEWVAFGSYNFEYAADDRLAEAMITTRDPRLVQELTQTLSARTRHQDYRRVSAADWALRSAGERMRHVAIWPVRRWL